MEFIAASHYDKKYASWQTVDSDTAAELNAFKFAHFVQSDVRVVLDFGCGNGDLLRLLKPNRAIGIDINPINVDRMRSLGMEAYHDLSAVPDDTVDLVISNHAVEHVESPIGTFREIKRVLKPGRRMVVVVPCDSVRVPFVKGDRDFHLFSWSAGNLGNIALAAGFDVAEVKEIVHRWPPRYALLRRKMGLNALHIICRIYGAIRRSRSQVRVVAVKPIG